MESSAQVPLPEMVVVPAGEFIMGTSDEQIMRLYWKEDWAREWHEDGMFNIEQPQHWVDLPAYEIGKYPVTNEEYYLFIYQSNYKLPKGWIGFRYTEGTQRHPVVGVSMHDAVAYCNWLSKATKREYRLPTEAEWEKACRGVDGRIYPWGEDFDPWRCNTLESGLEGTSAVDVYVPAGVSPMGAVDMCGNVWEWTSSPLLPYPYDPDPPPPARGEQYRYVVRGGAWNYTRKLARCAAREGNIPDYVSPSLGFRIARSLE
ncbi:MAG: SUMF1/EgtB/PvdO family nonheme iron enzyme [Anaerolineae bacterium]|nr:SUMF1/EgtB/PvdO family nonheme iron enzyme [Anaerolineae bacterium]